jgi:hypothetical protein
MTDADRILQEMLDLNMLEREDDGTLTAVSPRLWRWRDRAGDKEWQRMRRKRMRQEDAEARKVFRVVKKSFLKALGRAVDAASNPPTFEEVAEIALVLIEARDCFRTISSEEAFNEYWELEEQLKGWRVQALECALRKPHTAYWCSFLFENGCWLSKEQFEEEITALEDKIREERRPLEAEIVRSLTREDLAKLNAYEVRR